MGKKIILLLLLALCPAVHATTNTAGAFTRYNTDARIAGLGGTGVALSNDATAIYWNPANLSNLDRNNLTLTSSKAFETDYLSAFLAMPGKTFSWGIGYTGAHIDDILGTQQNSDNRSEKTGANYTYNATALYLATSLAITQQLSIGVTGKYIEEKIGTSNTHGTGLDVGITYQPLSWLRLATHTQNLISPSLAGEILPTAYTGGLSLSLIEKTLILSSEAEKQTGRSTKFNSGIEYWPVNCLAIRAGVHDSHLTFGTGLCLDTLHLNASWEAPYQDNLDALYRFSASLNF